MAKRKNHALIGAAFGSVAGYFGGAVVGPKLINPSTPFAPITANQHQNASTGVKVAGSIVGALLGHYVGKKV